MRRFKAVVRKVTALNRIKRPRTTEMTFTGSETSILKRNLFVKRPKLLINENATLYKFYHLFVLVTLIYSMIKYSLM